MIPRGLLLCNDEVPHVLHQISSKITDDGKIYKKRCQRCGHILTFQGWRDAHNFTQTFVVGYDVRREYMPHTIARYDARKAALIEEQRNAVRARQREQKRRAAAERKVK